MKKSLVTILIAFAFTANAQLMIDSTANWQQMIPTILGGNCVQISNVTQSSGARSNAKYTNFTGFGNGIIITTGKATLAKGPNNNASAGYAYNRPGDPTLSTLAGGITLDAVKLEFDFTSAVTDTVKIDYIFASEEYPEYVSSGFNDVFAFFVSGPGITGNQNIALVPGTNLPVTINNINAASNNTYYVTNASGSAFMQYDGYTTPLQAKFYAQAGVTYHLKIAIADGLDYLFDSAVFLKAYASNPQNIQGNIAHQGQPVTAGTAELFGYNINPGQAPLLDVQPIVNGNYTFTNVSSGAYNVRVTLDPVLYPNTYPMYYDSAYTWNDADIISIPCATYNIDMQLMVAQNGNGTVTGTIENTPDPLVKSLSTPAVGAHILLVGQTDNRVYGYDTTDLAGTYFFNNIPNGSYKIIVDVTGIPMDSIRIVTILADTLAYVNQNYLIGPNKIVANVNPQNIMGMITYQGQSVTSGIAELFTHSTDSVSATLVATQAIVDGGYIFNNVNVADYNVRITLDKNLYPASYPTYNTRNFIWYNANVIALPCEFYYSVDAPAIPLQNGPATLSGIISKTADTLNLPTTTYNNIIAYNSAHVLLVGTIDNVVYAYTETNAAGYYQFDNINYGSYTIFVDVPGLYLDSIHTVTMSVANLSDTAQNYLVGANKIIIPYSIVEPLSVTENIVSGISLFPNPANDATMLRFNLAKSTKVKADIVDVTGKLVSTIYNGQMAAGMQQLQPNVKSLSNGLYFIRLQTEGAIAKTIKLVKTSN